jgi:uncharacterized protein
VAASFLAGVGKSASAPSLIIERTGRMLASAVELADTSETRRRGLLGRDSLDLSAALIIAPCSAIHTAFMRFVIDVAFVDRSGRVLKVVHDLHPWRIAASFRAFAVIEMHRGSLRRSGVAVGDQVRVVQETK